MTTPTTQAIKDAYYAGVNTKANGANTTNCNFRHFATPEQTKAWEAGKKGCPAEEYFKEL